MRTAAVVSVAKGYEALDLDSDCSRLVEADDTWLMPFGQRAVCGIYFVFGARNSGKSTFVHYAMNQLLNEEDRVYLVDADCG